MRPDPNDTEFTEERIDKVEREDKGYAVTHEGWTLWLSDDENESGVVPKVGDTMRMYGEGIGRPVRGVLINGQIVRYRTAAEDDAKWRAEREKHDAEQVAKAMAARPETDRRVAALPTVLRERIEKFRKGNRDFWWQYESYELFCCEQAVVIADYFRERGGAEALKVWNKKSYAEQQVDGPKLDDGHSGNTFGMSVRLGYDLLTNPKIAAHEHGALTPLVGCQEYGCPHKEAVTA